MEVYEKTIWISRGVLGFIALRELLRRVSEARRIIMRLRGDSKIGSPLEMLEFIGWKVSANRQQAGLNPIPRWSEYVRRLV